MSSNRKIATKSGIERFRIKKQNRTCEFGDESPDGGNKLGIIRWLTETKTRKVVLGLGVLILIPALALGWWLGSPLFLNKTVDEEFPLTSNAVIPDSMTRAQAEATMESASGEVIVASEGMTEQMGEPSTVRVKTGSFRDEDRLHRGSGTATIYTLDDGKNFLRLEDLDVTNGPDLFVLLMGDPEGRDKSQGYVDLGRLKGNRGNQNYEIPPDVVLGDHNAVMIYCRAFSVIFSTAPLADATA